MRHGFTLDWLRHHGDLHDDVTGNRSLPRLHWWSPKDNWGIHYGKQVYQFGLIIWCWKFTLTKIINLPSFHWISFFGRKQKILPAALSLVVSFISALIILGSTTEIYMWGTQWWITTNVATVVSIIITERVIIPWLYPLKLTSVFEVNLLSRKSKINLKIILPSFEMVRYVLL